MYENVTERDWDLLCDLLEKVARMPLSGGGGWRERRARVEAEAASRGADAALEEFVSWWQGE